MSSGEGGGNCLLGWQLNTSSSMEEVIMASIQNQHSAPSTTVRTDTSLQQAIQLRALELYERRGRESGHELEDWLQAESELTTRQSKKAAA
jgi:hypothetical protein